MTEATIHTRIEEHIGWITLSHPKRKNALTPEMLSQTTEILREWRDEAADGALRCVVIRGEGEEAFSGGYDVTRLPGGGEGAGRGGDGDPLATTLSAIQECPLPVLAMIHGVAFGGACELAVTCDLRLGSSALRMSMPPAKLGLVYRPEGLRKFVDLVGPAYAREMFYSGRVYDADQCLRMGLVNHVYPVGDLEEATRELALDIAANAPLSVKAAKRMIALMQPPLFATPEERREANGLVVQSFLSEDFKEGRTAFLEKRPPHFKGK